MYGNEDYPIAVHEPQDNTERILRPVNDQDQHNKLKQVEFQEFLEKVFLLDVSIEYETGIDEEFVSNRRYILYFFHEQIAFFKKFIVANELTINYLVTYVRENYPYFSSRVFELLLGYMNTNFLISKFDKFDSSKIQVFLNMEGIEQVYNNPQNKSYILEYAVNEIFFESVYSVKYY